MTGRKKQAKIAKRGATNTDSLPDTYERKTANGKTADDRVTLGELRRMMREFVAQRAWEKFHTPRNLAASAAVEAGELLELFQWLTAEEAQRRCKEDAAFRTAVGEEMSDVLMYLLSLANAIGIDLGAAAFAKMEKVRLKYPVEKFHGNYERPLK